MRLSIPQPELKEHPLNILRRAGYAYIRSRKTGQESFVRRLGPNFYPRLHLYVESGNGVVNFNLHLDQKEASYVGAHAHNADYDGPVVSAEIERLKNYVLSSLQASRSDGSSSRDSAQAPKSFWRRLFG